MKEDMIFRLTQLENKIEGLCQLALDMGRLIRSLDEAGEHSEWWTQDGDYIIDGRFPK